MNEGARPAPKIVKASEFGLDVRFDLKSLGIDYGEGVFGCFSAFGLVGAGNLRDMAWKRNHLRTRKIWR